MKPFLVVDGEPLSNDRCRKMLHAAGQLGAVIGTLLQQYVIERELARTPFDVKPAWLEIAIADFCARHDIPDRAALDDWLAVHGDDATAFTARLAQEFQLERLRHAIAAPQLAAYFEDRRPFLDRVLLSRAAFADLPAATAQRAALDAGAAVALVPLAPIDRAELPPDLRRALMTARPGDHVGPLPVADGWAIYRFDAAQPASFADPELLRALRNELFERWLGEQVERLVVELG